MHKKTYATGVTVVSGLAVTLLVAACGGGTSSGTSKHGGSAHAPATLKVALVAPSATNDLSWTQTMYSALESLRAPEHLQISVADNQYVTADAANTIRGYASHGYNLVIAHGSQYGSTIQQLAPQFPKVSFAWGTAGSTFGQPNVFAYEAAANEGGYIEGYIAAKMSKSHVLGAIGPIATGDDKLFLDGFKAGALAADPSVTIHPVYTGSYSDVSLYATAAKTFVSERADVLAGTTQASAGAIGIARSHNLPWFGNDWSMVSLAPKNVVATEVYNWAPALRQIFASIRRGKLGGATYDITLGNKGETIVMNPAYKLPPTLKAEVGKLADKIANGTLKVPQ